MDDDKPEIIFPEVEAPSGGYGASNIPPIRDYQEDFGGSEDIFGGSENYF